MLAKLFAQTEKMIDLHAFLEESDAIILPKVEPIFCMMGLYSTLCKLYSKCRDNAALLEALSKCVGSSLCSVPLFCLLLELQTYQRRVERYQDSDHSWFHKANHIAHKQHIMPLLQIPPRFLHISNQWPSHHLLQSGLHSPATWFVLDLTTKPATSFLTPAVCVFNIMLKTT